MMVVLHRIPSPTTTAGLPPSSTDDDDYNYCHHLHLHLCDDGCQSFFSFVVVVVVFGWLYYITDKLHREARSYVPSFSTSLGSMSAYVVVVVVDGGDGDDDGCGNGSCLGYKKKTTE